MIRPYRSMLFVPGQRPSWVEKALRAGPDAVILDLEDAVAESAKAEARDAVVESLRTHAGTSGTAFWGRPNDLHSEHVGFDVEALVRPGLTGLVLPKLDGRDDVIRYDALVTHAEHRNGVEIGSTAFLASLETAPGMAHCEEIASASPRMTALVGATARDADTARSLGYRFSLEGHETLYLRSRILLASRAAGHAFAVCGMWQDIADLDGLRSFAQAQRDLGYDGQMLIHPNHVAPVHEIYGPDAAEIEFYRGMVAAFEEAAAGGAASVDYRGQHIDAAHAKTARAIVASASRD
ncbi:CoA ester lyase [Actinomycetospora endophytica]|uniref:CoA ester lyase n=1 Tax=Actinomycetospora endophytica TaxID=2291215 RepID=A0ABS8PED1_9PSEU|nr:CoA ester lyase [Actinomycetospora endophytica]MCD2195339.1 CoA ester lyase [Actinomycetospora endophytica]